jgi:hypothetical protein
MAEKGVLPATSGATPRAPNSAMSAFAKLLLKGAGAPSTQNRRSDPGGAEPTEVGAGRRRENVPPCICCIDSFEPFLGGSASIGAIGRARSVCGTRPPPAVHPAPAMGRKVSDELTSHTVPLCRSHHRDNHRFGDEVTWWERRAIDPIATSRMLWVSTRRIE